MGHRGEWEKFFLTAGNSIGYMVFKKLIKNIGVYLTATNVKILISVESRLQHSPKWVSWSRFGTAAQNFNLSHGSHMGPMSEWSHGPDTGLMWA